MDEVPEDDTDSSSTNADESDIVATVNGTKWRLDDKVTKRPINGIVPEKDFAIENPVGDTLTRNSGDFGLFRLAFFANVSTESIDTNDYINK